MVDWDAILLAVSNRDLDALKALVCGFGDGGAQPNDTGDDDSGGNGPKHP